MNVYIWGAGEEGRRLINFIGSKNVIAFIESDIQKQGSVFCEKKVISFEDYLDSDNGTFIIISPLTTVDIIEKLKKNNVYSYFKQSDCPTEFSEPQSKSILKDRISLEILESNKIYLYGCTYYTLLLNEWIKEQKGRYADIILPKDIDIRLKKAICYNNPKMNVLSEDEFQNIDLKGKNKLFISDEWRVEYVKEKYNLENNIINAFDISDREEKYYNKQIKEIKNSHYGEDCFIVGLGPSLSINDLQKIDEYNICSFGVNTIFNVFDKIKWRPNYYVSTDGVNFKNKLYRHPEKYCKEKAFISDGDMTFWTKNKSEKNIKFHYRYNTSDYIEEGFSDDPSRVVYYGGTVIYACLQIAVYMGFKNIYLLGIDLVDMKKNGIDYNYNYTHSKEVDGENLFNGFWVKNIMKGYYSAKKYADKNDINIYNATRGGYLELFPRISIDQLLYKKFSNCSADSIQK